MQPGLRAVGRGVRALVVHLPLRVGLSGLHEPQRCAALLLDARHRRAQPVEQRPRVSGFEQDAARHRRGPPHVADRVMRMSRIAELRCPRILPGAEVLALALPPALDEARNLVLLGRLPRQAKRRTAHVGVEVRVDRLAVGRHDLHRYVGDQLVGRLVPRRDQEPELVALDGTAHRAREHVNVLDGVRAVDAEWSGPKLGAGVVALPASAAESEERCAAEDVAAILQHAVHANAAARGIRRYRARHDRDFRLQHVVEVGL